MPLSQPEKRRLRELRRRERSLWKKLFRGPAVDAPILQTDVRVYERTLESLTKLESKLHGTELAERMAVDRTMRRVAAEQAKAANQLMSRQAKILEDLLKGIEGVTDRSAINAAVNASIAEMKATADTVIPEAMRKMNLIANSLDRSRFVQAFGQAAFKNVRNLGIEFGSGIDVKLVDKIWSGRSQELYRMLGRRSKELKTTLHGLVAAGRNARTALPALEAAGFPQARTSKWVRNLEKSAMRALKGHPDARKAFNLRMRQARKYIDARRGPTVGTRGAGKKLLANLQRAVDAGQETAVRQAVSNWTSKKTLYNSISTMRTATNETYRELQHTLAMEKPYIYLMQRILSINHPKPDQCDAIAAADLGWGAGRYPINMVPGEHHGGLCRDEPVIDKKYLSTGKPLAFEIPKGTEGKIKRLGAGGSFAKTANGADSPAALREMMRENNMIGNPRVPLQRLPRDEVPGDNILRAA